MTSSQAPFSDGSSSTLRPGWLARFEGQTSVRRNLEIFLKAAQYRDEPLDHVLFLGPPGLGKTTLAHIIAREMQAQIKVLAAPVIKLGDLVAILTQLKPKDVLFIDEIHRLSRPVEEMLYSAMEDFRLDILLGQGPGARSVTLNLPRFTLVGATTRLGLISAPLRDRFPIQESLTFYSPGDMTTILHQAAQHWQLAVTPAGIAEIAGRARGTPRIGLRLLRRVRDFAHGQQADAMDKPDIESALEHLGIDAQGLDALDRRYLSFLGQQGGPVGLNTLAAALSEDPETLEDVVEPFLIQLGWIERTARGRCLLKTL